MKNLLAMLLIISSASTGLADGVTEAQEKLAGIWKLVSGEEDGQPFPAEAKEKSRIVFEKNKFAFRAGEISVPTVYTIDPMKGTISIAPPIGETKTLRGLYKLEGNHLTLCVTDGDMVPTKFAGGKNIMLLVLEREKK